VDAVFGNMYLHHDSDPAVAIVELARILKTGGKLVLTDLDAHEEAWMHEEMADVWLGFDREQIKAWFEKAGLKDVTVNNAAGRCESTNPTGRATSLTIFAAVGSK
ncbi:MAG: methyltransferase domain-containing protein, partial [Chloroflexota bacterium]